MHHPVDIQWWLKILIFTNLYPRSGEQTNTNNSCQVLYREWWEILDLGNSKLTTTRSESSTSKWFLEVLRIWVHFHDDIRGSWSHVSGSFSLLILFWCSLPSPAPRAESLDIGGPGILVIMYQFWGWLADWSLCSNTTNRHFHQTSCFNKSTFEYWKILVFWQSDGALQWK